MSTESAEDRWVQRAVLNTLVGLSILMLMVIAYFWGFGALVVAIVYGVFQGAADRETRPKD